MGYHEMSEMREKLEEYCELENDEHGEAVSLLCQMVSRSDYVNEEFAIALEKEMAEQLATYQERTRIVEREETSTHTVRELEWD
jgi:hypothetical protein